MSITPDGWFDWSIREPGPPEKVYPQRNAMQGMALHSMEGSYAGSLSRLKGTDEASWCLSVKVDGVLVQHYPVTASCWASGNSKANTTLVSCELEGRAGTPANPAQVGTLMRVARELGSFAGWEPKRSEPGRTLHEHREVWDWATPNAGPTSCPSGRYAPFYEALAWGQKPADDVTLAEIVSVLGGPDVIRDWIARGAVLLPGYAAEQQKLGQLRADFDNRPEVTGGKVPPHKHEMAIVVSETGGVKR